MKILICSGIFPPDPGGPATYSRELATALVSRGHDVTVLTYADADSSVTDYAFPVVRIVRRRFKPWHYYQYFRAVKKIGRGMDILYAQDPVSAGYPTFLAAKILKKPFAVKVTGDYSWEQAMRRGATDAMIDDFQKIRRFPKGIQLMRNIQIHVCREARVVVTPAEYLKRLIVAWGVKEKKVRVIRNATPTLPHLSRESERTALGVARDAFLVVSVGRDVRWKGFGVLTAVAQSLEKEIPALVLKILQNESRELVLQYMAAADVFVLNSAYEGISHLTLEAMGLGVPVVVTRVGGNFELVADGETGVMIDFDNQEQLREALRKLYHDPDLRRKLVQNAKVGLGRFTNERMINETEGVLQECVF